MLVTILLQTLVMMLVCPVLHRQKGGCMCWLPVCLLALCLSITTFGHSKPEGDLSDHNSLCNFEDLFK